MMVMVMVMAVDVNFLNGQMINIVMMETTMKNVTMMVVHVARKIQLMDGIATA